MNEHLIRLLLLSMILTISIGENSWAAGKYGTYNGDGGGSGPASSISETQARRSTERFNILDFIKNQQSAVNAQNSKYGRGGGGGSGPYLDLGLGYSQDTGPVTRDGITIGKDSRSTGRIQFFLDDLITRGNRTKLLNIDLGVEGFYSLTTGFTQDSAFTQTSHTYKETGGGLLIRPIGRSSQDTGLTVKGGYVSVDETGLWANNTLPTTLYAPYLGAETKLYLLNFLGIYGDYQNMLETSSTSLAGKWKMQRFKYGAFLEIYLLNLSAYLVSTEMNFTGNTSGVMVKELYSGAGFSATLYF